jgi:hypothetical protein
MYFLVLITFGETPPVTPFTLLLLTALGPDIFCSTLPSGIFTLSPSLGTRDEVSWPYKRICKVVVYHIVTIKLLGRGRVEESLLS